MNIVIIYAHPALESLNASLRCVMVNRLQGAGHAVQISDLYAMGWKAALDGDDFLNRDPGTRLDLALDSKRAFLDGQQSPDIAAEQEKLLAADAVILQFPLWWFSMPAILKGWVERVYAHGFAYGVGEHSKYRWGDRYGEGVMAGKRAMLVVTAGGWASHYSSRGINGPIDDLLFPIHHGILYYPGFTVLPAFVSYGVGSGRVSKAQYEDMVTALETRMDELFTIDPIPFRRQNFGDYEIPAMTLRSELAPGVVGFAAHRSDSK
ncbi:NAD(P)H-dependent oxidoreductase [Ralstonia pseudosolanacearum]|uniref:Flavodoxin family protein n=1 Tax=Ralstonia solanacearum TaxID=305 RepID=A0AA92EA64_RALSL|nr:NAD(P)H-dependent oxidoreductase [Ralstonia pseudosolanacearum]QCX48149.1 flavodoxin family protein [Ralstonia pseudosolanacearum]